MIINLTINLVKEIPTGCNRIIEAEFEESGYTRCAAHIAALKSAKAKE
jgi:hypothetical protein